MDSFPEPDNDGIYKSRLRYIRDIVMALSSGVMRSFPTAIQEKMFKDVLCHLVGAISDETKPPALFPIGITPSCRMKRSRKDLLKEILSLLLSLQRQRLYNPPADDEIGYYLLIQRYLRSIITFFALGPEIGLVYVEGDDDKIDCYTLQRPMLHLMELSELNKHLADISAFVSEADIRRGPSVTPLMGIDEKIEVPPLIKGSEEKSNAFYLNKFRLAQLDLRSTEFAHCPPLDEEKRLYVQLLDDLALTSSVAVEEANVFSHLLCSLFVERTERDCKDLERHCKRIKDVILEKLSLAERYELILEQFKLETEQFKSQTADLGDEHDPDAIDLTDLKRKLALCCGVSSKELPDYIRCVDKYQRVAVNVAVFIISRLSDNERIFRCVDYRLRTGHETQETGWALLHALTLVKQAHTEFQHEVKWMQKCGSQKNKNNENLNSLRSIIEDLRFIGSLDVKTDEEEGQLLLKIWHNVGSSIQFFTSAIADEQRHYINNCGGLCDGRIPGLGTSQRTRYIAPEDVQCRLPQLADEVSNLSFILAALRDGLLEITEKDGALC